jgi:hypothetical protein
MLPVTLTRVLIPRPVLDGIVEGRVTLAFRRWDRPRAKAGALHRTPVGLVAIDSVDVVRLDSITAADARAAGAASRAELLRFLRGSQERASQGRRAGRRSAAPGSEGRSRAKQAGSAGQVYRMRLHYAGADPRIALRADAVLSDTDLATLQGRLARLDRASRRGPWTREVLELIAANPARRAPDLAAIRGLPTQPFKADVRKLKELGLTESLEVGYRIAPRGRAYLDRSALPASRDFDPGSGADGASERHLEGQSRGGDGASEVT